MYLTILTLLLEDSYRLPFMSSFPDFHVTWLVVALGRQLTARSRITKISSNISPSRRKVVDPNVVTRPRGWKTNKTVPHD